MPDQNAALPVAGWYPDPEVAANDRWWDGTQWSDHRRPHEEPATASAALATQPYGAPQPYGATQPYGTTQTQLAPYGTTYYGVAQPQNTAALVGFILALVGFVVGFITYGALALAGGIVSIVGLVKANQLKKAGLPGHRYGMALTGVIVGFGSIVLSILLIVFYFGLVFGAFGSGYGYTG